MKNNAQQAGKFMILGSLAFGALDNGLAAYACLPNSMYRCDTNRAPRPTPTIVYHQVRAPIGGHPWQTTFHSDLLGISMAGMATCVGTQEPTHIVSAPTRIQDR